MKSVKCKNCAIYLDGWCFKVSDDPDQNLERDCQHFVQKTNYSKIKRMNADQLAKFLVENGRNCNNCTELQQLQDSSFEKYMNEKCNENCVAHCKEWLSKEVNGDEN